MAIKDRPWPVCRALSASALVTSALVCRTAGATPSARLVYSRTTEASSCPDEAELRKAVATRLGYDPFFAWAKQTVVVLISRPKGKYVAKLQLVDEQGVAHGNRELVSRSATCAEVFEASALAIGIALDAEAADEAEPKSTTQQREPPSPVPAPAPSTPASPPPAAPAETAPAASAPAAKPTAGPGAGAGLSWALSIDALASAGTAPSLAPGVAIGATLALLPWSLSLELRADAPESQSRAASLGGGSVVSSMSAVDLVPCGNVSYFALCGLGMLGVTDAWGADITPQQARSTLFAAAGLRAGVELPLGASFFLRAHADGFFDLHRATLSLGQEAPNDVWSAPSVGGTLGIGVAHYFR